MNQPINFHIRSDDDLVRAQRLLTCDRVISALSKRFQIPTKPNVLCLLDNEDFWDLKRLHGEANRGLFFPVYEQGLNGLIPQKFWNLATKTNSNSREIDYPFDCLIYVHGSTCGTEIGLTLTLAHELRHFLQYGSERKTWAANALLQNLPEPHRSQFRFWWDLPVEKDARLVAKQVAEDVHGAESVREYIIKKATERVTDEDGLDWDFVLSLSSTTPISVVEDTRLLVSKNKLQLQILQREWLQNSDIFELDLDSFA